MSLMSVSTCSKFSFTPTLPDDSDCLTPTYTDMISNMSTAHTPPGETRPFFRPPYYLPADSDCSTATFSTYEVSNVTLVEEESSATSRLVARGDCLAPHQSKSEEQDTHTANSSCTLTPWYDPMVGDSSSLRSLGDSKPAIRTRDGYVFPEWSWSRPNVDASPSDLSVTSMLIQMRALKDPPSFYELRDMNDGPELAWTDIDLNNLVDDAPRVTRIPSQYHLDDLKDYTLFNSVATAEHAKPVKKIHLC
ncbi:unnamed protein product [Toxocara canis]|uniref:Uncharacterized protein n=1 Tax=Toxocara canis TaxID=6265 RepID=A0A183UYN5_TOXCA|nr:unnamed protein product [Toxocara canis]